MVAEAKSLPTYPKQKAFCLADYYSVAMTGGVGCVAAETLIEGVPIAELSPWSSVPTLMGKGLAYALGSRGREELYRVETESGRVVVVTLSHRFLTPNGWRQLRHLGDEALIAAYGSGHDPIDLKTQRDSLASCSRDSRRRGELLHPAVVAALDKSLLLHRTDGESSASGYGPFHACKSCFSSRVPANHEANDGQLWQHATCGESPLDRRCTPDLIPTSIRHSYSEILSHPSADQILGHAAQPQCKSRISEEPWMPSLRAGQDAYRRHSLCPISENTEQSLRNHASERCRRDRCLCRPILQQTLSPSELQDECSCDYIISFWDKIVNIQFVKFGEFYDLHVPEENHYAAHGLWNHNSGKSRAGAMRLLSRSKANRHYMVVAPSYPMMIKSTFPIFQEYAEMLGLWTRGCYNETKKTARLANGATFFICSAEDPEGLRGPSCSELWGDEMQASKEEAFTILKGRLREGGKRGKSQWTFTPGSPDHWTSKHFIKNCSVEAFERINTAFGPARIKCLKSPDGDGVFFRASLKENTFIEPAFYQSLLKDYAASPMRILRELEGECVYMEGAEWDASYFDNLWFNEWPAVKHGGIRVVSLDSSLGKEGKGDDYAAYVKCLWQDGIMYLDADMRKRQDSSIISHNGVQIYRDFNPHYFVVEEELGMNLLIADMHKIADEQGVLMAITPMGTDKIPKEQRIRRLTPYISRKQFRFKAGSPGAKLLQEQLMAFPLSEFDDGPDSLEYNVRCLVLATTGKILPPREIAYAAMGQGV